MLAFYQWLRQHRLVNWVILIAYFLIVVLPHEQVGLFISKLFKGVPLESYNATILGLSISLALLLLIPFILRIKKLEKKQTLIFYTAATLLLITFCLHTIIIFNVELIHVFQYAVFAILAFPLFEHYTLTLIMTTLFGAYDEAYQYFWLSPERTDYYDMNDVIFNTLGGGVGLLWIKSYEIQQMRLGWKKWITSLPVLLFMLTIITILGLILFGVMSYGPSDSVDPLWSLVREMPEGFWKSLRKGEIVYHITLPLEGLCYILLLWLFYSRLTS